MLSYFERKHQVRAHLDFFPRGIPDTEWMSTVALWDETTVVVCADGRILKNKVERKVLKECNLMFVCLSPGWTHLEWTIYGWKIIKAWPDIVKNVEQAPYPMAFEVAVGSLKIQSRGLIRDL